MFRKILLTFLFIAVLITGAGAQESEPVAQDFFLSFVPNVQFSPFYVGLEKGYFADAGYDFTLTYGDENIGVEQIASGALSFGAISGEQVLLARGGERPVVYVYSWFQQYPVGVMIADATGTATLEDLRGKGIGIPGRFGASYSGIVALLAANGMTETDVQLEAIGFNAPDVLCAEQLEAVTIYLNNEPIQVQARIEAGICSDVTGITVIPVSEFTQMVSNGIVTNERMIAEQPDAVRAVVAAFDQALADTINNPAEAYLISLEYIENLTVSDALRAALEDAATERAELLAESPDRETITSANAALFESLLEQFPRGELTQFEVLLETIKLWDGDQLGVSTPEAWTHTLEILNQTGASLDEGIIDAAYTLDFLPERATSGE